jgi:hypothetical protein
LSLKIKHPLRTNCCLLVTLPKTIILLYWFFFWFQMHMEEGILVYAKTPCLDVCSELHFTFSSSKRDVPVFRRKKKAAFMHVRTHAQTERHQQSSSSISAYFFYSKKDAASPLRFSRVRFAGRRRCKLLACSI